MMNYAETATWLLKHDNYLLITHVRPDGDTLGSAAGLCQALRDMGKCSYILENPETTERYAEFVEPYYAPNDYVPGKVICLDTADTNLFPLNIGSYGERIDLAIDHHASHNQYASNACVLAGHAACGEIIYRILQHCPVKVSSDIAASLYLAIVTDTGCFRYSNTSPETLRICADLMEYDVPVSYINKKFFRTKSLARILLESKMLSNVSLYDDGLIAVACITNALKKEVGATENDTDDIASIVGQIEGVRISVTISELDESWCKISVRTWPEVDASAICSALGGGGHRAAAGCVVKGDIELAERKIVEAARRIVRKNGYVRQEHS